jgi:hypothetical protein
MASEKQVQAAKRNVKKAQQGASAKKTIAHLPAKPARRSASMARRSLPASVAGLARPRPGRSFTKSRGAEASKADQKWAAMNSLAVGED